MKIKDLVDQAETELVDRGEIDRENPKKGDARKVALKAFEKAGNGLREQNYNASDVLKAIEKAATN